MSNFGFTRETAKNLILGDTIKIDGKLITDLFFRVDRSCHVEVIGSFEFNIVKGK